MHAGLLFHSDSKIDMARLRSLARLEVENSLLIHSAEKGSAAAACALHIGFWPFVTEFEIAIDQHVLPRAPLRKKYGPKANTAFFGIASAVRGMKEEEGSHAAHWRRDAAELGISDLSAPMHSAVKALIADAYSPDLPRFFSVLAGTEYIAEELSAFLLGSRLYTNLFARKRWLWGEVHVAPHEDGPSHLEIDLDLARAYGPDTPDAIAKIEAMVRDTISRFGDAAKEVGAALA